MYGTLAQQPVVHRADLAIHIGIPSVTGYIHTPSNKLRTGYPQDPVNRSVDARISRIEQDPGEAGRPGSRGP